MKYVGEGYWLRQLETLSRERRQTLLERSAKELAEFFSVYEGKLLGTAAWRRMTGKSESQHEPYTFIPTDEEINDKRLRMQYCCASDKYTRGSKMEAFLGGWKSGAATVKSVFRKCEYDWRIVCDYLQRWRGLKEADLTTLRKGNAYLARLQGSPSGLVTWQMDFTASGLVIDTVTIVTESITTENGQVDWKLEGGEDIVQDLALNSDQVSITTSSLSGCKSLKLTASLSGGNGNAAWQHAQLFSQPIDSEDDCSLDVTVTLKDSVS
ncbi:Peptide-N(4)-(N-acetyl-beta- glucosaminyl)asparagine amidase [Desmophyllum pertusum]|uniref:Peptide-N(4)-(N-acetyl-beta-glucosaminyl)asparagine amidase n=1 Tax=Desmophyllum pertusum TaxID=174260 RepID=A0A9W9ZFL0_9CNID|nr:Peptide-N(4)-(N-acetyl-beta- glucosaminyl)asparagine amidase [Desmophyllum pertusum]